MVADTKEETLLVHVVHVVRLELVFSWDNFELLEVRSDEVGIAGKCPLLVEVSGVAGRKFGVTVKKTCQPVLAEFCDRRVVVFSVQDGRPWL